jgi:hypothetical protein
MTDMSPLGDNPDKWIKMVEECGPKFETVLRKLGIYVVDMGLAPDPRQAFSQDPLAPVLVINGTIGDVAFSERVQHPVEERLDVEFKKLDNQMSKQEFEDLREKIERNMREGKDPLGTTSEEAEEEPSPEEEGEG